MHAVYMHYTWCACTYMIVYVHVCSLEAVDSIYNVNITHVDYLYLHCYSTWCIPFSFGLQDKTVLDIISDPTGKHNYVDLFIRVCISADARLGMSGLSFLLLFIPCHVVAPY